MKLILTIIYLILTTGGITFMKLGGNSILLKFDNVINFKIGVLTLVGFILYIFSFILWQKLVTNFDLSYIVPITAGIIQIIILLVGHFIFKEIINIRSVFGTLFVIIGIIIIAIGKR